MMDRHRSGLAIAGLSFASCASAIVLLSCQSLQDHDLGKHYWVDVAGYPSTDHVLKRLSKIQRMDIDVKTELAFVQSLREFLPVRWSQECDPHDDAAFRESFYRFRPETPMDIVLCGLVRDLEQYFVIHEGVLWIGPLGYEGPRMTRVYDLPDVRVHELQATIEKTVCPSEWEDAGGESTLASLSGSGNVREKIIVSSTYQVHQQIEGLLESLTKTYGWKKHHWHDPAREFFRPANAAPVLGPASPTGLGRTGTGARGTGCWGGTFGGGGMM
jgi:hypothetical protein